MNNSFILSLVPLAAVFVVFAVIRSVVAKRQSGATTTTPGTTLRLMKIATLRVTLYYYPVLLRLGGPIGLRVNFGYYPMDCFVLHQDY